MKVTRELTEEDNFPAVYEHYSKDVEIGATQSNAGTLGLNQQERRDRFTKPVIPHISRIHAKELKQNEDWRLL
jgi:hypothetical protein